VAGPSRLVVAPRKTADCCFREKSAVAVDVLARLFMTQGGHSSLNRCMLEMLRGLRRLTIPLVVMEQVPAPACTTGVVGVPVL